MATSQDSRTAGIKWRLDDIIEWIEQTDEIIPPILAKAKVTALDAADYIQIAVAENWMKDLSCDVCQRVEEIENILYGRREENATENKSAEDQRLREPC